MTIETLKARLITSGSGVIFFTFLSTVLATTGLLTNSATTVIGAMLFSIATSILLYYFEKSKITKYTSGAISLSLSVLLISYAYSLIKKDCVCSASWKRTFMLFHGVLLLVPNLFMAYKSLQ